MEWKEVIGYDCEGDRFRSIFYAGQDSRVFAEIVIPQKDNGFPYECEFYLDVWINPRHYFDLEEAKSYCELAVALYISKEDRLDAALPKAEPEKKKEKSWGLLSFLR